ncbi:hypothetical protein CY34DRAFT_802948 [Suillus luteus UH-Slu-Lm8-n1]|uniref:C2H2-type domain-containing protein n=1 Tax=Suillus luteus UH-Slu-Lm8-n1 TaxID=930992 RepID=A0A0D0A2F6_9AGAM|nr:hypothetical protein CY34DRAFT_802948 [Suillus luteus UH-Slu-Lm8-n1]
MESYLIPTILARLAIFPSTESYFRQQKFDGPLAFLLICAGTSPAYEAENPTNWYSDSWNDGTPGEFVQIYILQLGFIIIQYALRHSSLQRTHSSEEMFLCLWVGAGGLHCGDLIRGCNLNAHLRQVHGVRGADKDRMFCRWRSCNREFNKENLARHIEEIHMRIVHTCTVCGAEFSRKDTLTKHRATSKH